MSEVKKRRVHSAKFKAKMGMEAIHGVKTLNEIGQEYGVHPVVVGQWRKEIVERAATLFEGKRGSKPAAHADEDRLYSEIGRLKIELDWLKKNPDYELRDTKRKCELTQVARASFYGQRRSSSTEEMDTA